MKIRQKTFAARAAALALVCALGAAACGCAEQTATPSVETTVTETDRFGNLVLAIRALDHSVSGGSAAFFVRIRETAVVTAMTVHDRTPT